MTIKKGDLVEIKHIHDHGIVQLVLGPLVKSKLNNSAIIIWSFYWNVKVIG